MAPSPYRRGRYWLDTASGLIARPGGTLKALRWLGMYAAARILLVRRITRAIAGDRPPLLSMADSVFEVDVVPLAELLRRNGFDASLRLPAQVVEELLSLGKDITASTPNSAPEPKSLAPLNRIAHDPAIRNLAALYLGCTPIYRGSRVWWTRPNETADPTETGSRFHYDLYDYRAVVFLLYLTDVDRSTGAHVCVRGSHRLRSWSQQVHPRRHRSDEEILRSYGPDSIVTICGPAGMVIAEDPLCFHKVIPPSNGARLAAQLLYTGGDLPAPSFSRGGPAVPGDGPRARDRD